MLMITCKQLLAGKIKVKFPSAQLNIQWNVEIQLGNFYLRFDKLEVLLPYMQQNFKPAAYAEPRQVIKNGNPNLASVLPSARGCRFTQHFTNTFALESTYARCTHFCVSCDSCARKGTIENASEVTKSKLFLSEIEENGAAATTTVHVPLRGVLLVWKMT